MERPAQDDYYPEPLRDNDRAINERVYERQQRCLQGGLRDPQAVYDEAVHPLFDTLDWIEERLGEKRYLTGERVTEADWRLFTTMVRFDPVYHGHFKCNRRRIVDYPNLWGWTREMYQWPGVAQTVKFAHIVRHYHCSHDTIDPHRIIPIGPDLDLKAPHGREDVGSA